MTHRRFVAADHHFTHRRVIEFTHNGELMRPFASVEEHDQYIIFCHNRVVRPQDTTYFLGDVAINKRGLECLAKMNGRKILVKGNHDVYKAQEYLKYFEDIRACKVIEGKAILTHIPVHEIELERFKHNVHGHLHAKIVGHPGYTCVSMEQINFTPVDLDELLQ